MGIQMDADEKLREIVNLSRLYDLYGELLNSHTREIFEAYVLDNYSLSEIAEEQNMTRQGVRDIVVRGSKKLLEFEDKLGFLEKTTRLDEKLAMTGKKLENIRRLFEEKNDGMLPEIEHDIDISEKLLREAEDIL